MCLQVVGPHEKMRPRKGIRKFKLHRGRKASVRQPEQTS
jgi:hypothetical protein